MTKGFSGKCIVPDVFFVNDGTMVFNQKNGNRPRIKERITNIEAKKHFQEQRKRALGFHAAQLLIATTFSIQEQGNTSGYGTNKGQFKEKESTVMTYHDGTQQLLTDALLSKYLDKRKNDPIWQGISHLMLIPPEVKQPIKKYQYQYIRS